MKTTMKYAVSKVVRNVAMVAAFAGLAVAAQAQTTTTTKAGTPVQTTASTPTKSVKMKDMQKTNPDADKMKQDQTPTATAVTNKDVAKTNAGMKQTTTAQDKIGANTVSPEDGGGLARAKNKRVKTHVPRGNAYGWHRKHDAVRVGSK